MDKGQMEKGQVDKPQQTPEQQTELWDRLCGENNTNQVKPDANRAADCVNYLLAKGVLPHTIIDGLDGGTTPELPELSNAAKEEASRVKPGSGFDGGASNENLKSDIRPKPDMRDMKPQGDIITNISDDIDEDGKLSPESTKFLQDVLANGKLGAVVDEINHELHQDRSPYRVAEIEYNQSVTYEQNRGSVSLNPAPLQRENKRAELSIFSLYQGKATDQVLIKDDPIIRGYESPN